MTATSANSRGSYDHDSSGVDQQDGSSGTQDLGRTAVKSLMWSGLGFGFTRIVVFITTLLLAKLLVPEDFGVVAAGLSVMAYLEIILDLGIGAAVIYEQQSDVSSSRLNTAFTLNLGVCIILTAAGWLAAPWLADFFHTPHQEWIYRALFLFLLLRGVSQIHDAMLKRDLRYRRRAAVDISRGIARAVVSIPLALTGFGAWAIVAGVLASEFTGSVLNWILVPFRPRLQLDRTAASTLLQFGLAVTALKVFAEIGLNADYLVVGNRLGPTQLGYYNLAYRIPEMILGGAYWVFSSVAFPVYSKARSSSGTDLGSTMLRVLRLSCLFGFTVGVVLALCSRDVVATLLGPHWLPIAVPLAILSLTMGLESIGYASGDIFPAVGRPGLLLAINIPLTIFLVGGFILACSHGIATVAAVHLTFTVLYGAFRLVLGCRLTKTTVSAGLTAMRPAVCTAAGIVALALPVRLLTDGGALSLTAILAASLAGGAIGLFLGGRDAISEIAVVARHALARS
ncbi:lipopolysaccharide exporter [Mycobacterium frederiksbergense]|uniref:Lipopolysaccharide exporter n=1 Tax=Mycolicibacterium frederiksbergense TaxID=117567 RepID=A0ABT6L1H1_9MYCO|nr:lipopolysaccharide biosynthesis protein [Mycolicibacterium frederiksbergense]MDH6196797.1 lipopolysaccharide exporter [Mycolicibacterium frederiksbergense]